MSGAPLLSVAVEHRLGDFTLDAAFTAEPGLTALFGRSGSGKTTLIKAIAGTLRPERGTILLGDEPLLDTGRGVVLPPHRRRIATVFQDARLFPHLTVRQNLAFGRFFTPRAERRGDVAAVVALLDIGPLLHRRPAGLSGGERSRVAIGRALLASPRLLLMDEPLAALDEGRKAEILPYLERLRDEVGIPILYVSHAVSEVARLAGTVVLVEAGRVAAVGPPDVVLRRADLPAGPDGAEASALVVLAVAGHDEAYALTRLSGPAGDLEVPRLDLPPGTPVRVRIRARDVLLARERPAGLSARNALTGRIRALAPAGAEAVLVEIACGDAILAARVTRKSAAELGLAQGEAVVAVVKSLAFDPGTMGRRAAARVDL